MIENDTIVGQEVIIAYADQSHAEPDIVPTGNIELVPVRLSEVVSASRPGGTITLEFSVGKLIYASDLAAFNSEVTSLTGNSLPRWVDGRPDGLYCRELNSRPTNFIETDELSLWEEVIRQLAGRKDFEEEDTFLAVVGLLSDSESKAMSANLRLTPLPDLLPANTDRWLLLYHYHPVKPPAPGLTISATVGQELNLESASTVRVDSPYDIKRFLVRTGEPPFGKKGSWITLVTEGPALSESFQLEMAVQVRGSWLKRLGVAAVIAIGLAGAQMGTFLMSRSGLGTQATVGWGILMLAFSFGVGVAAVWGIRRNP